MTSCNNTFRCSQPSDFMNPVGSRCDTEILPNSADSVTMVRGLL